MSFSDGFRAGSGMVSQFADIADRRRMMDERAKDAELRRQRDQFELDRMKQDAGDRQEMRDASAPVNASVGQQLRVAGGGNTFFSDPAAAAATADQERAIAEMSGGQGAGAQLASAASAGGRIFNSETEARDHADSENTPMRRMERQADVLARQGRVDAELGLRNKMGAERLASTNRALDAVLAGGDEAAAIGEFNSGGVDKFGKNDSMRIIRRYDITKPGYAPIPTAEIEITKGGKTTRIADAYAVRYQLGQKAMEMAKVGDEAQRADRRDTAIEADRAHGRRLAEAAGARDERRIGNEERRAATDERRAASQERRDDAMVGWYSRRAASGGEGGGAGGGAQGTIDPKDLNDAGKYFGERGREEFGLDAVDADPKTREQRTRQFNSYRLLAERLMKNTMARGDGASREEVSQAAMEAMRNPQSRGFVELPAAEGQEPQVVPVVRFNGRAYVAGPAQARPAAPAQGGGGAPQAAQQPASRGARLAEAAASGSRIVQAPAQTRTPEQFRQQLAEVDAQIAGMRRAQAQVAQAIAGAKNDPARLQTLLEQMKVLNTQAAQLGVARNQLVR